MGARWRKRLGDLGSEEDDIEVRSTTKQRAMASAQAFLSGYLGDENNPTETDLNRIPLNQKIINILRKTMSCSDSMPTALNITNLAERVANKTGVSLSISDISLVWQICR